MRPIRELMQDKRVAGALAAVALVFVAYRVVQSGKGSPPPAGPGVVATTTPPAAPAEPHPVAFEPAAAPPPAEFPPGWTGPSWTWERNPFLAPARERIPGKAVGGMTGGEGRPAVAGMDGALPELRGTVVSRDASMAIFGNRLVPAGGTIGEWTLVKVDPYRVSLRKGSEIRVLELYRQ